MSDLVSVVLPVGPGARGALEALEDLKRQSWKELEIIAVLNGCPKEIREAYQMESSSRLRLIDHGDTPNLLKALSSAIDASSGKWLARMDTDDPYGEFEQCAPYAVNVQIKTEMKTPKKGVLAHADLQRVAQILKNANYRGNVVMEYEEEDSYDGVPGAMDKLRTYFGG